MRKPSDGAPLFHAGYRVAQPSLCREHVGMARCCRAQFGVRVKIRCGAIVERAVDLVRSTQLDLDAERIRAIALPAVVGGVRDHAGSNRIELNIVIALQRILGVLRETGLVASLPLRAGACMHMIEVPDVAPPEVLHHA